MHVTLRHIYAADFASGVNVAGSGGIINDIILLDLNSGTTTYSNFVIDNLKRIVDPKGLGYSLLNSSGE